MGRPDDVRSFVMEVLLGPSSAPHLRKICADGIAPQTTAVSLLLCALAASNAMYLFTRTRSYKMHLRTVSLLERVCLILWAEDRTSRIL